MRRPPPYTASDIVREEKPDSEPPAKPATLRGIVFGVPMVMALISGTAAGVVSYMATNARLESQIIAITVMVEDSREEIKMLRDQSAVTTLWRQDVAARMATRDDVKEVRELVQELRRELRTR